MWKKKKLVVAVILIMYHSSRFIDKKTGKIDKRILNMYKSGNEKKSIFLRILFNIFYIFIYFLWNIILFIALAFVHFCRSNKIKFLKFTIKILFFFLSIYFINHYNLYLILLILSIIDYVYNNKFVKSNEPLFNKIFVYINTYLVNIMNFLLKISSKKVRYLFKDIRRFRPSDVKKDNSFLSFLKSKKLKFKKSKKSKKNKKN